MPGSSPGKCARRGRDRHQRPALCESTRLSPSRSGIHRIWKAALEAAGLPTTWEVHAARHCYATDSAAARAQHAGGDTGECEPGRRGREAGCRDGVVGARMTRPGGLDRHRGGSKRCPGSPLTIEVADPAGAGLTAISLRRLSPARKRAATRGGSGSARSAWPASATSRLHRRRRSSERIDALDLPVNVPQVQVGVPQHLRP